MAKENEIPMQITINVMLEGLKKDLKEVGEILEGNEEILKPLFTKDDYGRLHRRKREWDTIQE